MSTIRYLGGRSPGGADATRPAPRPTTTPTPSRALRETPRPSRTSSDDLPAIPEKIYFRIGEVSDLVGVEPHVLRYWEQEFRSVRPTKSQRGQRVYTRRDVELLRRIRTLLYEEKFTIAGARKALRMRGVEPAELSPEIASVSYVDVREGGDPHGTPAPSSVSRGAHEPTPTPPPSVAQGLGAHATRVLTEVRAGLAELLTTLDAPAERG